jgi:dynein heavy chain 2
MYPSHRLLVFYLSIYGYIL